MPNYCAYDMRIKGTKENVYTLIDYLKSGYSHEDGIWESEADHHFFRVFEANHEKETDEVLGNGEIVANVFGDCAWSVYSCMFEGDHAYYTQWQEKAKVFKAITLPKASEKLGLTIEVYSKEPGIGFMEHYLIENGEILIDDCHNDYREIEDENGDWVETGGVEWIFSF